jgi:hypothetical protein
VRRWPHLGIQDWASRSAGSASWCLSSRRCLRCSPPWQPAPRFRRWGAESRAVAGHHVKDDRIGEPGPGGLSRARIDGITRFAARGKRQLPTTRSPGSDRRHLGAKRRPPCFARPPTGAVSCHIPWPDACAPVAAWLWADARAADSSAAAARQSASEVSRIGMAGIGQPRARQQILRSRRRSEGAQS